MSFKPFKNESDVIEIDNITFENRKDQIEIYGSISITADKVGFQKLMMFNRQCNMIYNAMVNMNLPDRIEKSDPVVEVVANPFKVIPIIPVKYGCNYEIDDNEIPNDCYFGTEMENDCAYAVNIAINNGKKEDCKYWKPIDIIKKR